MDDIFNTSDDIFDIDDEDDFIADPRDEEVIMNFYRGCSEEFLRNELENDPLLRAYAEKIDEHYGQGNVKMVLGIEDTEGNAAFWNEPGFEEDVMPHYVVRQTAAERNKNGLFQTVLESPYTVAEFSTGDIITISERDKWYENTGRSVEWQKVSENCPLSRIGMTVRFYGSERAFKRAKRKSSYWRNQNVIVETRWYTSFWENRWLLYVWHTQPLLAIPVDMLNR